MACSGRVPVVGDDAGGARLDGRGSRGMDGRRVDRLRFIPVPDEPVADEDADDEAAGGEAARVSHALALWISLLLLLGQRLLRRCRVRGDGRAALDRSSRWPPPAAPGRGWRSTALEHLGSMLATAQLGITVCSVGLGALAEAALHEMLEDVFHAWHLDQWISDAWLGPIALFVALQHRRLPPRRHRRDDPQEPRHRRSRPRRAAARPAAPLRRRGRCGRWSG